MNGHNAYFIHDQPQSVVRKFLKEHANNHFNSKLLFAFYVFFLKKNAFYVKHHAHALVSKIWEQVDQRVHMKETANTESSQHYILSWTFSHELWEGMKDPQAATKWTMYWMYRAISLPTQSIPVPTETEQNFWVSLNLVRCLLMLQT